MIVFTNVTKQFPTGQVALDDVSFEVEPGEFVFLVGESGAGKTTIMRLLTKEMSPTQGVVSFLQKNLAELKKHAIPYLRREVSVVFQDYKLLPDRTVEENIRLPLEIAGKTAAEMKQRVDDLLDLVGLAEKKLHFPVQLSGGEAQRVSIARALAIGPKVVFADEPTGNLDHESSLIIGKLLHKIHELGTTVIMATHNMDVVRALKKREIHLHKGKIVKDTKKKEHPHHKEEKVEHTQTDKKEEKKEEDHGKAI